MKCFLSCVLLTLASAGAPQARARAIELDLPANSIAYSTQTHMLYATIASSAGITYGNRLIEISPSSALITGSAVVGSEPGPLAISPDAPLAYVGLNGSAMVRPVDILTLAPGTQFSMGSSGFLGPYYAQQIAVMPGSPASIAVSMVTSGGQGTLAVFDNGMMRGTIDGSIPYANAIAFSDPNTLFGFDYSELGRPAQWK